MFLIRYLLLLLAISCQHFNVLARVITTSDIKVIRKEISSLTAKDIVAFDVTNVLFRFKDSILTRQHKKDYAKLINLIRQEFGEERTDILKSIIIRDAPIEPVDAEIAPLIKSLQKKRIRVIALTNGKTGNFGEIKSREELRTQRLKSIGIDFRGSFSDKEILLSDNLQSQPINRLPKFQNGIVFTSSTDKGSALREFLKKVKFKPVKIVFVDNKLTNIRSVEQYCAANKIEFVGIHYTKIEEEPYVAYDEQVVNKQFEILKSQNIWLSDSQARCVIDSASGNTNMCVGK